MTQRTTQFGLTLPNRGVVTGATTVDEMLALGTPQQCIDKLKTTSMPAQPPSRCASPATARTSSLSA